MEYLSSHYRLLPSYPGVYQFLDENNQLLYVGKAKNLKNRVSSYFLQKDLGEKTKALVSQIKKIKITIVESELESLLLEAALIKKFEPKYNVNLKDGKSYPLIRITIKNKYPAILLARKPDDPQSIYFGPYPNAAAVKMVLKTLRRIFPYQSQMNHPKKMCLYYHLSLCPCLPYFIDDKKNKEYKKTLKHIIGLLNGEKTGVIKSLEKERNEESKKQNFEKAQLLQKQIAALTYVTTHVHKPFEYETNPNLRFDIREKEISDLQKILAEHTVITEKLKRIECFDISNLSTTNVVASMVVFINGEKDNSHYRRFKIKNVKGQNDFAAMHEVIQRRIQHLKDWGEPNLIIVDGGKGQISLALKALKEKNVNIPLIGLAKREEIIITSDFTEIKLAKSSPALQLVMRIRDEAHRFALTYQKLLRSKSFLP